MMKVKNFLLAFLLGVTSSCTMQEEKVHPVIQEVIKGKDISGIKLEIAKIPPKG